MSVEFDFVFSLLLSNWLFFKWAVYLLMETRLHRKQHNNFGASSKRYLSRPNRAQFNLYSFWACAHCILVHSRTVSPKYMLSIWPITVGTNNPLNQLRLKESIQSTRENVRKRATISFAFASDWLRNWREIFKLITKTLRNIQPIK